MLRRGSAAEGRPYLGLVVHSSEGIEELKGCEDLALYEQRCNDCGSCPIAGAWWHLEEPLLKRKLSDLRAIVESVGHNVEGIVVGWCGRLRRGELPEGRETAQRAAEQERLKPTHEVEEGMNSRCVARRDAAVLDGAGVCPKQ